MGTRTRTTRTASAKACAKRLASAERMIRGHVELLAVAERRGMEYETERQREAIAEWEREAEYMRELLS